MLEGEKDAAGRQALSGFPHGETRWQKTWLGLLFVCPRSGMAVHQGSLLVMVSTWHLLQQTKLLPSPLSSHCHGRIRRYNVPDPFLVLPHMCWQDSMSSDGTTVNLIGNWAAYTRLPTSPSPRAPEGHLQTFTAQQFFLGNCNWQ